MKQWMLLLAALIAFAPKSRAAGLNLAWDHCNGDGGVANKVFACDRNDGFETLNASFVLAAPIVLSRQELLFDFQTRTGVPMPVWWDVQTGASCRLNQIQVDSHPPADLSVCQSVVVSSDPGIIEIRYNFRLPTPDRTQYAVTLSGTGATLAAGVEYFSCRLVVSHQKSTGSGSCAGCSEPLAITFSGAAIRGGTTQTLTTPAAGNVVTWQSLATPTRRSSWAALKTLFR